MSDQKSGVYCTIDHANKRGASRDYDPYQYWLRQMKLREEMEAAAKDSTSDDYATESCGNNLFR